MPPALCALPPFCLCASPLAACCLAAACPARGADAHGAGAPGARPAGEPKAKKEKKEKKEKKAKADGEEKAKRPPSAYNIYMKLELSKSKAADPGLAHQDHFKAVAAKWKLLSKEEQQAFKGLSSGC